MGKQLQEREWQTQVFFWDPHLFSQGVHIEMGEAMHMVSEESLSLFNLTTQTDESWLSPIPTETSREAQMLYTH